MTLLQASIGVTNDLVDAPTDTGRADKPIPAGLVERPVARALAAVSAAGGLALAAVSGAATVATALGVLLVGYAYDLRFKGTAWSWLPFAVGIPILPVFAWLGAGQPLPAEFAILLPSAVLAGAGLAIANALADLDRDAASGTDSIAVRLGRRPAWTAQAIMLAGVAVIALVSTAAAGEAGEAAGQARGVGSAAMVGGAGLVLAGIALGARAERLGAGRRERAWELEALGVAALGLGWVAAARL